MKLALNCKNYIKNLFCSSLLCFILIFSNNSQAFKVLSMENPQTSLITEELRLKVPSEFKEVWINAEKNFWEPWLSQQIGFLGRQIFWDKEKEEALILVSWENKKLWKDISMDEVNKIQKKFEEDVKTSLNINFNPFELIYEGELVKQE